MMKTKPDTRQFKRRSKVRDWEFCSNVLFTYWMLVRLSFPLLCWLIEQANWSNFVVSITRKWFSFLLRRSQAHGHCGSSSLSRTDHSTNYDTNIATFARTSSVTLVTSSMHVHLTTILASSDILKNSNFAPLATLITQNLRPKSKLWKYYVLSLAFFFNPAKNYEVSSPFGS